MKKAFTLTELLTTFFIIGLVSALMVPNLIKARNESLRQTVRQQAKGLERALAEWYTAAPSIASASQEWNVGGTTDYLNQGQANRFINSILKDYMGGSGAQNKEYQGTSISNLNNPAFSVGAEGGIYTGEMAQVTTPTSGEKFIGGDAHSDGTLNSAHVRLYWDSNDRATTSPKVILYLPHVN